MRIIVHLQVSLEQDGHRTSFRYHDIQEWQATGVMVSIDRYTQGGYAPGFSLSMPGHFYPECADIRSEFQSQPIQCHL